MIHAVITPTGENVLTAESGNVVIWDLAEKQVQISQLQVKNVPSALFLVNQHMVVVRFYLGLR